MTTVTDVMILNYAVELCVACDGTQSNTQSVWPDKLPIWQSSSTTSGPHVRLEQKASPKLSNVSCKTTRDYIQVTDVDCFYVTFGEMM